MNPITFFIVGDPKGQPRPRAFAFHGHARVYNPATAEGWKNAIAVAAKPHRPPVPFTGPVSVTATFMFPRPKSHYRTGKHADELKPDAPCRHTSKPDRDNCEKALLDALTTLGFFKDDSQVCDGLIRKRYSLTPGCAVTIEEVEPFTNETPRPGAIPTRAMPHR